MADSKTRTRNRRGEGAQLGVDLVQAGLRILARERDQSAITIRGVAAEAGVSPQSVYLHFADRSELVWSVYELLFEDLRVALIESTPPGAPDLDVLRARARAYCAFGMEQPGAYGLMFSTVGISHQEWTQGVPGDAVFRLIAEPLGRCLGRALDDPDVQKRAAGLWATLHGFVTLQRSKPTFDWAGLGDLSDLAVETWARAATPRKASKSLTRRDART